MMKKYKNIHFLNTGLPLCMHRGLLVPRRLRGQIIGWSAALQEDLVWIVRVDHLYVQATACDVVQSSSNDDAASVESLKSRSGT